MSPRPEFTHLCPSSSTAAPSFRGHGTLTSASGSIFARKSLSGQDRALRMAGRIRQGDSLLRRRVAGLIYLRMAQWMDLTDTAAAEDYLERSRAIWPEGLVFATGSGKAA
jgi:hypothetical protein